MPDIMKYSASPKYIGCPCVMANVHISATQSGTTKQ